MINIQKIEKSNLSVDGSLDVHSVFYTIQGEGPFSGRPAIFIRLAGCNLQCPSCDTDYTSKRKIMTPLDILRAINAEFTVRGIGTDPEWNPLIVITGGEPLRQNIAPLIRTLLNNFYQVQLETNGSLYVEDIPWGSITVVCSPKTGKINSFLQRYISAYKYVLNANSVDRHDGLPILALDHTASPKVARPPPGAKVYLQPMDPGPDDPDQYKRNVDACIKSCMAHNYLLQLQTHKIVGLE